MARSDSMTWPLDSDGYVPRVLPIEGQKSILIFTMNRHQDVLNIYKADPLTGACKLIIRESVPKYVKEEAMEGIVTTKNHIVLPSDRDGYMHLYLYDMNGKLIRQIDKGPYEVTAVYGYDEATGCTYYQADKKTPMQRGVCGAGQRHFKGSDRAKRMEQCHLLYRL